MKKFNIADEDWGVRHRLDVRKVLDHYGAENRLETTSDRTGETWIVHSCLLDRVEPHHSNGDRNPSAWVSAETGRYCCATYWTGDLFHLVQKLEGKGELEDATAVLGGFLAGVRTTEDAVAEIGRFFADHAHEIELPSYAEAVLRPWAQTHPYMPEVRRVSHEACEALRIGWDPQANRIVFPHFWRGSLVGWQARAIPPDNPVDRRWPGTVPQQPKYKNTHGFPKARTLYGYDMALDLRARHVVVVESPMSVAKAHSLGLGVPVVATFGASVSKTHLQLLRSFPEVIVWFDSDPAGRKGEQKLVEGLYRHTVVKVVTPDTNMDLGDYETSEEVIAMLADAEPASLVFSRYVRK